jgi:glucose-6-phosphate isomerase
MDKLAYRNLDHCAVFTALQEEKQVDLSAVLTPERVGTYQVEYGNPAALTYNYAAKTVSPEVMARLADLSEEQQLIPKFRALAAGAAMNTGEGRMVLHHLCRGELAGSVVREGRNIGTFYREQQERIARFAAEVHAGVICSESGNPFSAVVQIGIGGSDLGPRALFMALQRHWYEYLGESRRGPMLETRFISNVDPDDAALVLNGLAPRTTLFVLVSKSGTTQETLTNEALALSWLRAGGVRSPRRHVVCVTSETSPLAGNEEYLDSFFIDDYIGGRYSATSAVGGVVLSLAFGPEVFSRVLIGAHAADTAALRADFSTNPPLIDAMIGVYERNVLGHATAAVLPYSQALIRFPAHLQQLDMESNGKQVNRDGEPLGYATGPIVFGEPGTNGQHSFYQLLHQGTDIVPLQFIGFAECMAGRDLEWDGSTSQTKLNANLAAQIVAFACGKDDANPNKRFPGARPSSLLFGKRLTPETLGALLAHFENKVMFQGLTWNINSFDQEGVQLGKVLTKQILAGEVTDPLLAAYAKLAGIE